MDLHAKLAAAENGDGIIRGLTDPECLAIIYNGHGRLIRSTGRWVITAAGLAAVKAGTVGEAA